MIGEKMKWVKIRLFTSTWHIWRQNIPLMKNYSEDLDATLEVEEFKPPEETWFPALKYVSKPHGFMATDGQMYELIAVVPEDYKEDVLKVWKEIGDPSLHPLEIADKLLDVIMECDEEPALRMHFDGYETEIEINSNYLPQEN